MQSKKLARTPLFRHPYPSANSNSSRKVFIRGRQAPCRICWASKGDSIADGAIVLSLQVEKRQLAPNGYLHAASVAACADSTAGYGCVAHLPAGASDFTTIELKSNFLGTALEGRIVAHATLVHGGRTTQIWDATVKGP